MIFSSLLFVFFFLPIVLIVYYVLRPFPMSMRNTWLFLTSLFFYAWGEPQFVCVMLISILANYLLGLGMGVFSKQSVQNALLGLALFFNIGLLFVFKYLNFTISTVNRIFPNALPQSNILLPIGISFFTFQALSYVIDVYRGKSPAQKNLINVGLYIAFFPQLIAGPIVRYETVEKQICSRRESISLFAEGVIRFLRGFCKKILLANSCGIIADEVFEVLRQCGNLTGSYAWIGIIAYTLQIFYDFSGYSDMAIGLGKMFGFVFEENFNYPYIAQNVTDFWRRWHISLSRWFRDYIYIPLGGSRVKPIRMVLNLLIVWTITGLWHGANWTFLLWGLWYFFLLTIERILGIPKYLETKPVLKAFYRILTLVLVMVGWVFFRSPSISRAFDFLKVMFCVNSNSWMDLRTIQILHENLLTLFVAVLLSTPIVKVAKEWLQRRVQSERVLSVLSCARTVGYLCLFLYAISFLVIDFYNPFIYFNF